MISTIAAALMSTNAAFAMEVMPSYLLKSDDCPPGYVAIPPIDSIPGPLPGDTSASKCYQSFLTLWYMNDGLFYNCVTTNCTMSGEGCYEETCVFTCVDAHDNGERLALWYYLDCLVNHN